MGLPVPLHCSQTHTDRAFPWDLLHGHQTQAGGILQREWPQGSTAGGLHHGAELWSDFSGQVSTRGPKTMLPTGGGVIISTRSRVEMQAVVETLIKNNYRLTIASETLGPEEFWILHCSGFGNICIHMMRSPRDRIQAETTKFTYVSFIYALHMWPGGNCKQDF